jgi:hypothetical protein|tara:strand:+ start:2437 stop:2832 length:396 start_codon:yes stop_codon:yes gene_type:complete
MKEEIKIVAIDYSDFSDVMKAITDKYEAILLDTGLSYIQCAKFKEESEAVGFSFEYGLDAEPFNFHIINKQLANLSEAKHQWEILVDVPVNDNEETDGKFLDFPIGTDVNEIWHWFEENYNVSVAKDLMGL